MRFLCPPGIRLIILDRLYSLRTRSPKSRFLCRKLAKSHYARVLSFITGQPYLCFYRLFVIASVLLCLPDSGYYLNFLWFTQIEYNHKTGKFQGPIGRISPRILGRVPWAAPRGFSLKLNCIIEIWPRRPNALPKWITVMCWNLRQILLIVSADLGFLVTFLHVKGFFTIKERNTYNFCY